jgi:hypothetical protein
MSQLSTLYEQVKQIEKLNDRLSDQLRSKTLIQFFVDDRINDPEEPAIQPILTVAGGLKSFPIVMFGLKEYVDAVLEELHPRQNIRSVLLPSKTELENRPHDWLDAGDSVIGFSGVTNDLNGPRIITGVNDDGYMWRYLADEGMEPRSANHDRWFQRRDWVKLEFVSTELEEQLEEIEVLQAAEIDGLQGMLTFLNDKQFLTEE